MLEEILLNLAAGLVQTLFEISAHELSVVFADPQKDALKDAYKYAFQEMLRDASQQIRNRTGEISEADLETVNLVMLDLLNREAAYLDFINVAVRQQQLDIERMLVRFRGVNGPARLHNIPFNPERAFAVIQAKLRQRLDDIAGQPESPLFHWWSVNVQREIQDTQKNMAAEIRDSLRELKTPNISDSPRLPLERPPRTEHFVNRDTELTQLLNELQPTRIVTLLGPGGIGKTALAAEAVWRLTGDNLYPANFPDGIIYHSFYENGEVALAYEHIVHSFGGESKTTSAIAAQRLLAGRRVLLILDGTERADDLPALLAICDQCSVLMTSRLRDNAGANFIDITPLTTEMAILLLSQWGSHWARDRMAMRQICELVGSLPLAVRLAGRYLVARSIRDTEYLEWLETTPLEALDHGRRQHDSIPILLERSVAQLSDQARQVLAVCGWLALAPFEGEVIAASLEMESVFIATRALGELVNYGLLIRTDQGYMVTHALVRTFARNRLAILPNVYRRLVRYFLNLTGGNMEPSDVPFEHLNKVLPHLEILLTDCASKQEWTMLLELARSTDHYLHSQGHWHLRLKASQMGVQAAQMLDDRYMEGDWLNNLGLIFRDLGQFSEATNSLQNAEKIYRDFDDTWSLVGVYNNLGLVSRDLGHTRTAMSYFELAWRLMHEEGADERAGDILGNLGLGYLSLGFPEQAEMYLKTALEFFRQRGDFSSMAMALCDLGTIKYQVGQLDWAGNRFNFALSISRKWGDVRNESAALLGLGNVCLAQENYQDALSFFNQVLLTFTKLDYKLGMAVAEQNIGDAYRGLEQYDNALQSYENALGILHEIGSEETSGALSGLGFIYCAKGDFDRAYSILTQTLDTCRRNGDRRNELAILNNLGAVYYHLEKFEIALTTYQNALQLAKEIGNLQNEIIALYNLGSVYNALGRESESTSSFREALAKLQNSQLRKARLERKLLQLLGYFN